MYTSGFPPFDSSSPPGVQTGFDSVASPLYHSDKDQSFFSSLQLQSNIEPSLRDDSQTAVTLASGYSCLSFALTHLPATVDGFQVHHQHYSPDDTTTSNSSGDINPFSHNQHASPSASYSCTPGLPPLSKASRGVTSAAQVLGQQPLFAHDHLHLPDLSAPSPFTAGSSPFDSTHTSSPFLESEAYYETMPPTPTDFGSATVGPLYSAPSPAPVLPLGEAGAGAGGQTPASDNYATQVAAQDHTLPFKYAENHIIDSVDPKKICIDDVGGDMDGDDGVGGSAGDGVGVGHGLGLSGDSEAIGFRGYGRFPDVLRQEESFFHYQDNTGHTHDHVDVVKTPSMLYQQQGPEGHFSYHQDGSATSLASNNLSHVVQLTSSLVPYVPESQYDPARADFSGLSSTNDARGLEDAEGDIDMHFQAKHRASDSAPADTVTTALGTGHKQIQMTRGPRPYAHQQEQHMRVQVQQHQKQAYPSKRRRGAVLAGDKTRQTAGTTRQPAQLAEASSSSSSLLSQTVYAGTLASAARRHIPSVPKQLAPGSAGHDYARDGDTPKSGSLDKLVEHEKSLEKKQYVCLFLFADCTGSFSNKNEWKRHIQCQHVRLQYWKCREEGCQKLVPTAERSVAGSTGGKGGSGSNSSSNGMANTFNRKDLYMQHMRRLHIPAYLKKEAEQIQKSKKRKAEAPLKPSQSKRQKQQVPSEAETSGAKGGNEVPMSKELAEWESNMKKQGLEAIRRRCDLPKEMDCPLPRCRTKFQGDNAWDSFLEHMADHLSKNPKGHIMDFVGPNHGTFINWVSHETVGIVHKDEHENRWKMTDFAAMPCSHAPASS